jgi:hypothetical protein
MQPPIRSALASVLAAMVLAVPAAGRAAEMLPPPAQRDCSVSFYGDSILYGGYGANLGNRLPDPPAAAMRRIRPAWKVSDHSVVGDSAHARMPAFVTQPMPTRVVVLQYGVNDAGQNHDYEPALRAMARHVKAQRRTLVITGLSQVRGSLSEPRGRYDAIARQIAVEEGAVFADWGSVSFDAAQMIDDIHPAQAYSTRLAQRLAMTLDRVAPECRV